MSTSWRVAPSHFRGHVGSCPHLNLKQQGVAGKAAQRPWAQPNAPWSQHGCHGSSLETPLLNICYGFLKIAIRYLEKVATRYGHKLHVYGTRFPYLSYFRRDSASNALAIRFTDNALIWRITLATLRHAFLVALKSID